jgi:hypothetical protein
MQNKCEPKNKSEPKKVWESPTLIVYGSVESLTQDCRNKALGSSDGFTFMGQSITNACS